MGRLGVWWWGITGGRRSRCEDLRVGWRGSGGWGLRVGVSGGGGLRVVGVSGEEVGGLAVLGGKGL